MAKDRKVVYTLALESDPASQKVAADFAKQFKVAEEAAKAATKAAKEATSATRAASTAAKAGGGGKGGFSAGYDKAARDEARRAAADEKREREQRLRELAADAVREKKILADRVRANVEASRASREAARQAKADNYKNRQAADEAATAQAVKDRAAAERTAAREAAQAARTQAAAVRTLHQEQSKLVSSLKQVAGGFVSIGRAAVLFGVSGEENIQKAVQALAKFEAGVAAVTGLVNIIEGGAKAWRAYAAAAAAAAAAQRGLSAGGAISAIGRGPVIAAGAAAAGAGLYAGSRIGQAFLSESSGAGYRRDVTDRIGLTDQAGEDARQKAANVAKLRANAAARRGNLDRRYEESGFYSSLSIQQAEATGGINAARAAAQQQVEAARANTQGINGRLNRGDYGNILDASREQQLAAGAEKAALQELLAIDERRKAIAEETGRTKLAAAKEETSVLREQLAIEQQKRNAVLEEIRGAKEAIGRASAGEVARANAIAERINKGGTPTVDEGDYLAKLGISSIGRAANEQRGEAALQGNSALQELLRKIDADSRKKVEEIRVKVDAAMKTEITITNDTAKTVKDVETAINGSRQKIVDAVRREFEAKTADDKVQRELQSATSGA